MKIAKIIYKWLLAFGVDPLKTLRAFRGLYDYFKDFRGLRAMQSSAVSNFPFGSSYPCLEDRFAQGGTAKGHYFHQDLLVARRIFQNNPMIHVDVGSRVDGFVAHVAAFRMIKVIDIRPISNIIPNVEFIQANMMMPTAENLVDCCDSLSCLHALEHFGLGRYGDPINYDGYMLGLGNLYGLLKRGGTLYISVPIGRQRIEFNAHRIFSVKYLLELFKEKYHIESFSYVDDQGDLYENVELSEPSIVDNFGCEYGCGIFELTKFSS
jgi:hypothetical protein